MSIGIMVAQMLTDKNYLLLVYYWLIGLSRRGDSITLQQQRYAGWVEVVQQLLIHDPFLRSSSQ